MNSDHLLFLFIFVPIIDIYFRQLLTWIVLFSHFTFENAPKSEDPLPYAFYVEDAEIIKNIHADVIQGQKRSTEDAITIIYQPQAVFRVRAVTRCSSTLSGQPKNIRRIGLKTAIALLDIIHQLHRAHGSGPLVRV